MKQTVLAVKEPRGGAGRQGHGVEPRMKEGTWFDASDTGCAAELAAVLALQPMLRFSLHGRVARALSVRPPSLSAVPSRRMPKPGPVARAPSAVSRPGKTSSYPLPACTYASKHSPSDAGSGSSEGCARTLSLSAAGLPCGAAVRRDGAALPIGSHQPSLCPLCKRNSERAVNPRSKATTPGLPAAHDSPPFPPTGTLSVTLQMHHSDWKKDNLRTRPSLAKPLSPLAPPASPPHLVGTRCLVEKLRGG
jgi:hypothetical protein